MILTPTATASSMCSIATTGKPMAANPYVKVNWADKIDLATGRPVETDDRQEGSRRAKGRSLAGDPRRKELGADGLRSRHGARLHQLAQLRRPLQATGATTGRRMYVQMDRATSGSSPRRRTRGYLKAVDPLTGKAKWEATKRHAAHVGRALDARAASCSQARRPANSKPSTPTPASKLWQFKTGPGIEGQPVTWSQDGVQYVAVDSGLGGVYTLYLGR